MKKRILAILVLLIIVCVPITALAADPWVIYDYSRFNSETFVYDNSGSIKADTSDEYASKLRDMKDKYGVTYVFVIAEDYSGDALEFADRIWEHGNFDKDFIALVIALGSRDFAVYTYGKGIDIMSNMYVDGMYNTVKSSLSDGNYNKALSDFTDLSKKMTESYKNDTNSVKTKDGVTIYRTYTAKNTNNSPIPGMILWFFIGGGICTVVIMLMEVKKHRQVKIATNADSYITDGEANMSVVDDSFLRTHTTKTKVSSSSSSSGGSSTRGSTSSRSSGRSTGGRSGKF